MVNKSRISAIFCYSSKYEEYINYVCNILKSIGITTRRWQKDYGNRISYYCDSLCYKELLPIKKYWYPNGEKIVPRDLELTPLTCRQWYIGDGTISHRYNRRPFIKLYTNGFTIPDVEWLIDKINKLGFKATRQPIHNEIHISSYSTKDFLNYIGKCPVKCYQYKFNYERGMV